MLTMFASPKPFKGHIGVIQENAFRSWLHLGFDVLVLGESEGAGEVSRRLGIRHIPRIDVNEFGTPLLPGLFAAAEQHARHDVLCYANADIILLSDFRQAVRILEKRRALLIGCRTDMDITEPIDFGVPDLEPKLKHEARHKGRLRTRGYADFFAYRRGVFRDIPPFALGRTTWDWWPIYGARRAGFPVIDATEVVTAIHQNHDYELTGGEKWVVDGPEAARNRALLPEDQRFDPRDATHVLTFDGLVRKPVHIKRRLRKFIVLHPVLGAPLKILRDVVTGRKTHK
jgi:hypothetical protein